jgi:CheY-like chemotaxis protein
MQGIKMAQIIKKLSKDDITKAELDKFSTEYFELMQRFGFAVDGRVLLSEVDPNKLNMQKSGGTNPPGQKGDYYKIGETVTHTVKRPDNAPQAKKGKEIYKEQDLSERSTETSLSKQESRICRDQFKILIVDDEPDIVEIHMRILKEEGNFHNIQIANSVETARYLVYKDQFDLILCDYRLGDGTGYQIYKDVLRLGRQDSFILVTGYSEFEETELKKAKIEVLTKSANFDNFNEQVRKKYFKFLEETLKPKLRKAAEMDLLINKLK